MVSPKLPTYSKTTFSFSAFQLLTMAVSTTQISILSIYFTVGFMANNVCGECYRPNFTNPYAILLNPDQSIYNDYYPIELSCQEAHTKNGLPDRTYCQNPGQDKPWDPDPSDGRCEAQCNTAELLDDDILVKVNGTQQTLVDSQSTGDFSCRVPGQYNGIESSLCTNGTFAYTTKPSTTKPSCLGYCPIYLEDLEKGLLYDGGPDTPVLRNSTVEYYADQATIIYQCEDGYHDLNCSVHGLPDDCTTTCVDGTWTPSQIPTCIESSRQSNVTTIQTPSQASTEDTISSTRLPTTDPSLNTTTRYNATTIEPLNTLRVTTIEIDECLSNPCQNNATCHDQINKYECECPDGFNGTLCQINIDDCANHTCQNGATCIDGVASFKCQCPEGFNGTYCENDIDECSSNPCKNNATCTDLVNEFKCSCAPGYQGVLCDEEIDECSSNPCQNNATCNDLFDEYECICLDGFNGTNCENNIDDCANHTCQNGATCIDKVTAYECQCPDGYDGTYCENVVTTPTMTTVIMTTDNTTSLGSTSEPILTTAEQDVTTSEPTTSLGTTLSSTALTTSTDSSATSVITTDLVATTDTPAAATTVTVAATTITSDITTISPDASTITPDATTVTSGMATISEGTTAPTVPASTTKTTSVITTEMVVTTDTPAAATTVTSDATTVTPDATTVTSGMTMISKRTTAPAAATTAITAATTVNPDVTTITADATTVSPGTATISQETTAPTTPASTTKSDSPTLSVSTSSLSETTESKETTATSTKSPAEPRTTEKPPTPLPCEGECLPTQVCNAMDQCECRPDYYEDEDDNEEPCKVPTSIDVTMTITEVNGQNPVYKPGYEDPESDEFKALEKDVCQPFNEIYRNETDYEGCRVIEFTEGSIIVNYVLTFVENSTIGVSNVTETVYEELQNPDGSFSGELTFNDTSLSVAPYDECDKGNYDCDKNATCIDLDEKGYTCECFPEVYVLPGQECPELPTTELPPITTEEPKEPGMEVWKVVVGVTVPIVSILTISIVGLVCWQYRRLDRTSPVSESTKLRTRPYQEDIGDSDRDASRPGSMMIMNNDGTVQEVVLPWRNDSSEGEFIFAPDIDSKGKNQMLPMVDYPSNYGPSSYDNDPLGNIVSSYDNYTYQNHDTRNTTEIDSRYF